MKQMFSGLATHGEASRIIGSRLQSALHRLANSHVLVIHPFADEDALPVALGGALANIIKIEIEDDGATVHAIRQNEVGIHVALIEVNHEIGILPEVPRA